MSSKETGREFVVPEDPNDRVTKTRRTVRVIMINSAEQTFLFEDSDPGIDDVRWWVTPGGGMDPGESEAQTAVREIAEETGYQLREEDLRGPVARRVVVHGYSDQVVTCEECFYLARVSDFDLDTSAHTEEERITLQRARWWGRDELARTSAWVWPARLLDLWDLLDRPADWPLELGRQEESTRAA